MASNTGFNFTKIQFAKVIYQASGPVVVKIPNYAGRVVIYGWSSVDDLVNGSAIIYSVLYEVACANITVDATTGALSAYIPNFINANSDHIIMVLVPTGTTTGTVTALLPTAIPQTLS